ncbi:MAG: polysaccharide pyruvyl transferase family protein [Saprospiraceae bacterium]|jgi:hypothetical protein|nr:polysaccharide pyruvyl transferase family protein [Saprospiraceae bacterium]
MAKIALITCYFHHNYGSMLQAYATEMLMKRLNLTYDTIACVSPKMCMQESNFVYIIKKILLRDWGLFFGKIKKMYFRKKYQDTFGKSDAIRNSYFNEFAARNFHLSKLPTSYLDLSKLAETYAAVIVGSDQLWKPDSVEHGYYTLNWVPEGVRKIAYSTSIGISEIPWFQRSSYKKFLNRFDFISLREQSACNIVRSLTGRDAELVLDPTLLFDADDWNSSLSIEDLNLSPYIFCYLLGDNLYQRSLIKKFQEVTGLKIVALLHLDEYIPSDECFADYAPYNVGPKEFISYIKNARYVFTDSFHCSVFSILYKKDFFTFNRYESSASNSTNTRIDNLLTLFNLQNRRINGDESVSDLLSLTWDYNIVKERLTFYRKKSFDFIKNAISGIK